MAKVRMSQKCAGGCGTWLGVGTQATNLHRGWWCTPCITLHKRTCSQFKHLVGAR